MIECTLQEAIERIKENGGRFYIEKCAEPYRYSYDTNLKRFIDQHGEKFELDGTEFDQTWIYEPPKSTAFQEWNENAGRVIDAHCDMWHQKGRKEGWNAAIDIITGDSQICLSPNEVEKVRELKEP